LAEELAARGVESFFCPMLTVVFLPEAAARLDGDLDGVQGLLFTSANGARAFAALSSRRDLPVFAVGDRTAVAAREAGFAAVDSAGGNVSDLAARVIERCNPTAGVFLHPAGTAVAGDLAGLLGAAGFVVRRAVLYEAQATQALSGEIRMALADGEVDLAIFYSPRSARTFVTLAGDAGLESACEKLEILCLSDAVAEAADAIMWRRVMVASKPTQAALLATLEDRLRAA